MHKHDISTWFIMLISTWYINTDVNKRKYTSFKENKRDLSKRKYFRAIANLVFIKIIINYINKLNFTTEDLQKNGTLKKFESL